MNVLTEIASLSLATGPVDGARSFWMPEAATTFAKDVDVVFDVITWICIFFFVLIMGFMFWFMWKYRQQGKDIGPGGPTHHTVLELTWSIIPLILVIGIFYIGMKGYINVQQPPKGSYEVYVTAQKWSWNFQHRNGASDSVLDIPAGTDVKLIMTSSDVLHALYIPAFRAKQDIVPGRARDIWFHVPDDTPDQIRQYDLFCAEYCGQQHSTMITTVNVVPKAQWEDYIQEKADIIKFLPDEMLACYAAKRVYPRCKSCHTLDGNDLTGPSFKGIWDRIETGEGVVFTDGSTLDSHYASGVYTDASDYVRQSIVNPQGHIREGYAGSMPTFQGQLTQREIDAMVMFLRDPYQVVDESGALLVDCDLAAAAKANAAAGGTDAAEGGTDGTQP